MSQVLVCIHFTAGCLEKTTMTKKNRTYILALFPHIFIFFFFFFFMLFVLFLSGFFVGSTYCLVLLHRPCRIFESRAKTCICAYNTREKYTSASTSPLLLATSTLPPYCYWLSCPVCVDSNYKVGTSPSHLCCSSWGCLFYCSNWVWVYVCIVQG